MVESAARTASPGPPGARDRAIITTAPTATQLLKDLVATPRTVITFGTTYDKRRLHQYSATPGATMPHSADFPSFATSSLLAARLGFVLEYGCEYLSAKEWAEWPSEMLAG